MESENRNIPQLMKNRHPCKKYKRETLKMKCAEFYNKEYTLDNTNDGNRDKMMEHLGHLTFNEQCNILKRWNHIDLTVELMKKKGQYGEASRLCLSKGMPKEALSSARESGNTALIAEYLLRYIQNDICQHQEMDKSETSKRIHELFDQLGRMKTNRELEGQAYLLKAELTGGIANERENVLGEALGAFKQCDPPCKAGQIDCLYLMLKNLTHTNISYVVEEMHTLFGVVELFEENTSTRDQDSWTIKSICNYLGYEHSTDGLFLSKSRLHRLDPDIKRICKTEKESDVKKSISIVLKELAYEWYTKIQSRMKRWVTNLQTCEECKSYHSHLRCGCLKKLLKIDLLHIELDGYLAATLKGLTIPAHQPIEASLEPCHVFFRHILPQEFIRRSSREEWYALADLLRKTKTRVKERLMIALRAEYTIVTRSKRKRSTNLFMKHHFLVKYLKLEMKPQEMMKTFEQDLHNELSRKENKPKAFGKIKHLGFLTYRDGNIESLAMRFIEAYDNISDFVDPMGALIKFTTLLRLLRGYDREILPDYNYLVMWIEYFLVVASCMATKVDNKMSFLLPTSYNHVTHYIDSSFDSRRQATMNAISRTGTKKLKLHVIQERINAIALFLCGESHSKGLINTVFSAGNMDSEVSERVVILSLTCLCNIERMPDTSSEHLLLRQLRSIQFPQTAPTRLKNAIETLKTAKGLLDVGNLLRELLFGRGEELHSYSFYKGNVQTKALTILNGMLPDTFHEEPPPQKTATNTENADTEKEEEGTFALHQANETNKPEERHDPKLEEATRTQLKPQETAILSERCVTQHEDTTLILNQQQKVDTSEKSVDADSENAACATLTNPLNDALEESVNTEKQKLTLNMFPTQGAGISAGHGSTKNVDLTGEETKQTTEDGQLEPNKVTGFDWFSLH